MVIFKRGDINAMAGSNPGSLVMVGGTLAEESPWTKLIVEEKTPQSVGKVSEGSFLFCY